ncbi:MAG TPA: DNA polymerase III subunit alpha [Candidatus Saccharibacteria bacterium]|nr:DNA polymerase III subunit alpha [Candidatus Saccharibacteria bacterium]
MSEAKNKTKNAPDLSLKPSDFVHLHVHTHHSLLDGLQKVPQVVEKVKLRGMSAVAVTDHGTLSGSIEFYKKAKEAGIKPIIGMEAYVANRKHTDKDPQLDRGRYHLIILAMNNTGYLNLMRLSSIANIDGYYYKPRIDHDLLQKYNEGLIILSGCIGGEVGDLLRQDQYKKAKDVALWYKSVFGDRYYLEVQDHGHPNHHKAWDEQIKLNKQLIKLSKDVDIPLVLTSDSHYLNSEDAEAHEILLCVQTLSKVTDEKRFSLQDFDLSLAEPEDIFERWQSELPEALANTKKIAERCDVSIELGGILIPEFPVPEGETERSMLVRLTYQGLVKRYSGLSISEQEVEALTPDQAKLKLSEDIVKRAEYELSVIDSMGFNGYFLIIWDFIAWGKNQGIIFGPGRGSAAGSIIAYSLNITEIDPLKFDLLFERFLNPDRISMPDIDIDIQDSRRDEVIQYCVRKYGKERVANIATFGTMAARAAVRDVARALDVPYAEADKLAKMIPPPIQGRHIPLSKSIVEDVDFSNEYKNNQQSKKIIDLAIKLEGTIRSHGMHAAGVVIAPDDLVKFAPLEISPKGSVATQYPMGPIEELGLLKMDFLGLANLTIINNAMRIIKKVYGENIDLSKLKDDDSEAFGLLQRGETTGVFQLESAGMRRYLKELKPTVLDDIVAMVALYRPGPMQFIDDFIARKHGKKEITYDHPGFKNSLEQTYGVMIYQEQFMQISKDMCGFTGGQADTLRKAVGKKKRDLMDKIQPEFVDGMVKVSGVKPKFAEDFWENKLVPFADYCFNKAHAACYGLIAYWTAYLKAHYPDAFMAALMTSNYDDNERLAGDISDCRSINIEVAPPDINESFSEFAIVPGEDKIRFGLMAIKNVGHGIAEEIVKVRTEDGSFESLNDFIERTAHLKNLNKKVWEALIKSGAFDHFAPREDILHNLDTILALCSRINKESNSSQSLLFGGDANSTTPTDLSLTKAPVEANQKEKLRWERELLGIYLSSHPLDSVLAHISSIATPIYQITKDMDGKEAKVVGIVAGARIITTKNGSKMAFVKIEDKIKQMEAIIFPKTYEAFSNLIVQDAIVMIKGKISTKDREGNGLEEVKIMADEIKHINEDWLKSQPVKLDNKPHANVQSDEDSKSEPKNKDAKPEMSEESKEESKTAKITKYYLKLKASDEQVLREIHRLVLANPPKQTKSQVILVFGEKPDQTAILLPQRVEADDSLSKALSLVVGEVNIVIK